MKTNKLNHFGVVAGLLLLSSCSGDGRPFEEAVEANNLQLNTLTIVQPIGLLPDLVVSPGERVSFTLSATNLANVPVSVASGNRRWSVDNPAVARVDDSGNLLALANGVTNVTVSIGSIGSQVFEVEVRDEVLQGIQSIVGRVPETDNFLERCLPQQYQAIGRFVSLDGSGTSSLRAVPDALWSVANQEMGSVAQPIDGFASVTAVNVDLLEVIATAENIAPLSRSITVEDTLMRIDIAPETAAVTLGNTLPLIALAEYDRGGIVRTDVDITQSVNWFTDEDNDVLSVGNEVFNRGVVTPIATGNQIVTASCGDLLQEKTVIVAASDSISENAISIESITLSFATGVQQLRLSSGSSFDADDEIDSGTTWRVIDDENIATITEGGIITPQSLGFATVQATNAGRFDEIEIQVIQ